ncbi:TraR/DksA C4-type zinc finger protein [bacterium]|nr:TraR/DksA C4-type zinc finger protein [bacterium]
MATKVKIPEAAQKQQEPERYSPDDSEYFRKLILERREKIKKGLSKFAEVSRSTVQEYSGNHSTYSLHMADQGTDAQEREKTFMFASREGRYLKYLDRALSMIDAGTYGYCESCGQLIQKKRLELVPTSRLCVACKLKLEQQNPK